MIISGKQIQNILKVYGEQNKIAKPAKSNQSGPTSRKDEVILSSEAKEFGQILQTIKNLPDVREDKVKAIAERMQAGTYNIEAKDVADKIIGHIMADRLR